jgi:hypothetical protein
MRIADSVQQLQGTILLIYDTGTRQETATSVVDPHSFRIWIKGAKPMQIHANPDPGQT